MSSANANKIQSATITLDQERAFDRVDWNFLFKALHFRYGPKIIQQIKTVYQNIETQVKVNGHLSQGFLVKRELQQGCLLSVIMFIIFPKVFLNNIRQNSDIKGIIIDGKVLKTSAFARTIYIGNNSSLANLETQLMHLEKATDIKHCETKCKGIWLGSNKGNPRKPPWFQWNSYILKNVDFIYGYNIVQAREQNW